MDGTISPEQSVIKPIPTLEKNEARPNQDIDRVVTSRGSVYSYLEDGRTQRFKTATKETNEPQDVLVYIPPYETLMDKSYWRECLIKNNINSSSSYESKLLEYTKSSQGKTILVTNKDGDELNSNEKVYQAKKEDKGVFIQLINKNQENNSLNLFFPVSEKPKIGWLTFDNRRYFDKDTGQWFHEKHIGNYVVEIHKKS